MQPELVIVMGQHRGGTSLICDLVYACGYSFGVGNLMVDRGARHEWSGRMGDENQTVEDTYAILQELHEMGGRALKLTQNLPTWLHLISHMSIDAVIVRVVRQPRAIQRSRSQGKPYVYPPGQCIYEAILYEQYGQAALCATVSLPILTLDFTRLIEKEINYVKRVAHFLDSPISPETLLTYIHPEIVENE